MNAAAIQGEGPLSPTERATARRLGLGLAVVVALGCDLIAVTMGGSTYDGWPAMAFGLVTGLLPVLAAAPFGWLLGPMLARAHLPGKFGIAVTMAILTMLLGDVLYVLGGTALSSAFAGDFYGPVDVPGLLVVALIGAIFVGPFVVALATLPAAVVWVCTFRLAWRSMGSVPTGGLS